MTRVGRWVLDEQMKWLVGLQRADSMLGDLERLERELPHEMERVSQEILEEHQRLEQAKTYLEELKGTRRRKERELEAEMEKVRKSQSRLFEVKTNKEYQALLKEIDRAKAANSALEEEILSLMEEMDERTRELQQQGKELEQVEERLISRREAIQSQLDGLGGEAQRWREEKEKAVAHIESGLMARYQRVAGRNNGSAVARVERGTCLGCFLSIPPQLFNEILKSGPVVQCPFCTRFIYHEPPQDDAGQAGKGN